MDQIFALLLFGVAGLWPWLSAKPPALSPPAIEMPATGTFTKQPPYKEADKSAAPTRPSLRFDSRPEGRPMVTCESRSSGWSRTTHNGRITAFKEDKPTRSDTCDANADAPAWPFGSSGSRPRLRPVQWEGVVGERL